MTRERVTRLSCDRPNCKEEAEFIEGTPKTAESSQWKRVYIGDNEAIGGEEFPDLNFQRILCPSCYEDLEEILTTYFCGEE